MGLSIKEAIAAMAATGQPYEVLEVERDGVTNRVFKNSPATLRQFFDLARGISRPFWSTRMRNGVSRT